MATKIAAYSCCCYCSCVSASLSLVHSEQKFTDMQLVGQPSTSYDHQIKQLMADNTCVVQQWAFCHASFEKYQKRTFILFDRRRFLFLRLQCPLLSHFVVGLGLFVCECVCGLVIAFRWLLTALGTTVRGQQLLSLSLFDSLSTLMYCAWAQCPVYNTNKLRLTLTGNSRIR